MTATIELADSTGDCLVIDKLSSGNYAIYIRSFDRDDYYTELQKIIDRAAFNGRKVTKEDVMEELDVALNMTPSELIRQLKAIVTQLQMEEEQDDRRIKFYSKSFESDRRNDCSKK